LAFFLKYCEARHYKDCRAEIVVYIGVNTQIGCKFEHYSFSEHINLARTVKIIFYIISLLTVSSIEFNKPLQIKAGKEVDGLILGNTTVQDAIKKYGPETKFTQGIACGAHDYFTNRFSFSKNGITIISETIDKEDKGKSKILKIGISGPFEAVTEKGIELKHDNLDKIVEQYGKPESTDTSKTFIDVNYNAKGISFRCDRYQKYILGIEIYLTDSSPDYWY